MANSLSIALTGLTALQRAVATTSNNIVNVGTEGYSRQTMSFEAGPTTASGGFYLGSGVSSTVIERAYDSFLVAQVRDFTASSSKLDTVASLSARLDDVLGDTESGFNQNIQTFFGAMQSLSSNPSGVPERQVVIAEAQALERQAQYLDSTLDQFDNEVNSRLKSLTDEVNLIAGNIAQVNGSIASLQGTGGSPNSLLDKRDSLVRDLAKRIGVSTIESESGEINVLVGSGQPIVTGINSSELSVIPNKLDGRRLDIAFSIGNASDVAITKQIKGGEMEGLLEFRDTILEQTRNDLGLVAVGLSEVVNAQHKKGIDLNDQFGLNFFSQAEVEVLANSGNAGSATLSATIADASVMQPSDYQASFDGTNWNIKRMSDSTMSIAAPGTVSLDGLSLTLGGAPANGDRFLVRATRNAASALEVQIKRPEQIAAALALRAETASGNTGSAAIDQVLVDDATSLPLAGNITLTFNPDALGAGVPGFDVAGITPAVVAYDPALDGLGKILTLTGIGRIEVSGQPSAGDVLVVQNNTGARGDNRNLLAMADLQSAKILANSQATLQDYYGRLVSTVGVKTRQAQVNASTENALLQQASTARDGVSGVNLDEEAANLLKLQQAYQAAAKIISVAETLFQTLLAATRT